MKKALLFVMIALLTTGSLFAARQSSTGGRVVNQDGEGVAYATVVLLSSGEQRAGATTDDEGHFSLAVAAGRYTLSVSHINYATYEEEVEIEEGKTIGIIQLNSTAQQIDAVVVKGQLVRREADRFVVDVANSAAAIGKDGVELLERAPGVWINDDKISINGKSGSKVYVNDRELKLNGEQLITYIKTLRAEEIQKIEVIPVSGADYDADSAAGIIKITLRRQRKNGTQGSVQHYTHLSPNGTIWNPSANIALHSGRFDMNGAAWFTDQDLDTYAMERTIYHSNGSNLRSESRMEDLHQDYGGRLDAVYELSKRHSIGLGGRFTQSENEQDNRSHSLLRGEELTQQTESRFLTSNPYSTASGTFNYVWKIDPLGSTLKLLAEYQHRTDEKENDNTSRVNGIDSLHRNNTDSKYRMATTSLAWEQHFTPNIVLQAGGKYTYYRMQSEALYEYDNGGGWLKNERESFLIDYDEQIAAAYAILRANFDRWGVVAGLRGEYTRTESDGTKLGKDYCSLFPNLNLSYKLNPEGKHMLIAQYARKISRPSFWQLNPQRSQVSDYTYQTGNPRLDPSYGNSLDLTLVLWYKYTLSAGMNLQTDEIQQNFLSDPNDPNIIYINHINYKDTRQYYLNLNTPLQLTKWWEANANLTYVAWEQRVSAGAPVCLHHMLQSYASTTFTLPAKFYIDLSWSYHNKIRMGNAVISANHTLNGSIKKRFGDRFTATFAVRNILAQEQTLGANTESFSRSYKLDQYGQNRSYQIGLVWHFKSGEAFRQRKLESSGEGRF